MKKQYFFLIFLLFRTIVLGQEITNVSNVATTGGSFLEIEVGGRAAGMGGAFVAVANDATTIYWNPAGMTQLPRSEVIAVHANWIAGIKFDFAGIVLPLGNIGTVGASITTLNMGEMMVRTVARPEGTGEKFSASDIALGISFARSLTDRFSIGVNAKYIRQAIWHSSASSVAIDVGTLYISPFKDLKIGVSVSNFGGDLKMEGRDALVKHDIDPVFYGNNNKINAYLETESWPLPLIFRIGLAIDVWKNETSRITLATDAIHPNNNYEYLNIGAEYIFKNLVNLQLGYKSLFLKEGEEGLTAGAGLNYKLTSVTYLKLNYTYTDFNRLNNTQTLAVAISF